MNALTIPYGRQNISLLLPHQYELFVPTLPAALPAATATVEQALAQPLGTPPLEEICGSGEKVLLIASDITRPVPYEVVLPPLLQRLERTGITEEQITLLFANGTHRPMTAEDASAILGQKLARRLRWHNHDANDKAMLVYLGRTGRGTPVWVNRLAVEADRVILTGAVVHHYFAGFGGGRKCLIPGVAGMETVLANHKLVLEHSGSGLHPACAPGSLDGNPVHEDIMEACEMLPPAFLLNVVLDPQHRVLSAAAGHWRQAHLQACRQADEVYGVRLPQQADLVIASCGGFPKDINVIQAHKTLDNTFRALSPGGVMILFAECAQGVGSADFFSWFNYTGEAELRAALNHNYSIHGHTALACRAKAEAARVILVSQLPPELTKTMGMIPAATPGEALAAAHTLLGTANPVTYFFPYGALTVPKL